MHSAAATRPSRPHRISVTAFVPSPLHVFRVSSTPSSIPILRRSTSGARLSSARLSAAVSVSTAPADENKDEERSTPHLGTLFRRFWKVAAPYWFSEDKVQARLMLAAVIALTLATTGIHVGFNFLNRDYMNALAKDQGRFAWQLLYFLVALAGVPERVVWEHGMRWDMKGLDGVTLKLVEDPELGVARPLVPRVAKEELRPMDVHALLQHLVTFGVVVREDKELYWKLVLSIAWRRQMLKLAVALGLEDTMMAMIEKLISKGHQPERYIDAADATVSDEFAEKSVCNGTLNVLYTGSFGDPVCNSTSRYLWASHSYKRKRKINGENRLIVESSREAKSEWSSEK